MRIPRIHGRPPHCLGLVVTDGRSPAKRGAAVERGKISDEGRTNQGDRVFRRRAAAGHAAPQFLGREGLRLRRRTRLHWPCSRSIPDALRPLLGPRAHSWLDRSNRRRSPHTGGGGTEYIISPAVLTPIRFLDKTKTRGHHGEAPACCALRGVRAPPLRYAAWTGRCANARQWRFGRQEQKAGCTLESSPQAPQSSTA